MAMPYAAYPNVNPQNVMGRSRRSPQRPTGGTVTPTPSIPTAPTGTRPRKTPVSPSRPNGPIYGGISNKYALGAR